MSEKKAVAVDLDGVIFEYDHWRGVDHFGKPMEDVRDALLALRNMGFEIVIYTTRANHYVNDRYFQLELIEKIEDALKKEQIPHDRIEWGCKPIAKYYIDDRAVRFEDWTQVLDFITKMETVDDEVPKAHE